VQTERKPGMLMMSADRPGEVCSGTRQPSTYSTWTGLSNACPGTRITRHSL